MTQDRFAGAKALGAPRLLGKRGEALFNVGREAKREQPSTLKGCPESGLLEKVPFSGVKSSSWKASGMCSDLPVAAFLGATGSR